MPVNTLDRYHIPSSMTPEATATLRQLYAMLASRPPVQRPQSLADWDAINAAIIALVEPMNAGVMSVLGATAIEDEIGGVPVVRIKADGAGADAAPVVYVHGGGWTSLSAMAMRGDAALFAKATGREVISIEYTLAPRATWQVITDQVITVWRALLDQGYNPSAMGMTGGSAGGNIVLASTLKIRDQALPMAGALYVASPATDLTFADDTCYTLAAVDPTLDADMLPVLADAYAGGDDLKKPYISPVYGDYSRPFPPTIISVGTREVLLSNAVRQYQAIRAGGHDAVLDAYEGVPHGFPGMLAMTPEGQTSIRRAAAFFAQHLTVR